VQFYIIKTYKYEKKTSFSTKGSSADLGPLSISRMLPNRYADKVGPFVFLDYVAPAIKETITKNGMGHIRIGALLH